MDFNVSPYFSNDDDAIAKNYHKILFVPGNPVQARELTQIQSILQNQIKMQGDHIFDNGTIVIPGNVYYDNRIISIKIDSIFNNNSVNSYIQNLVGNTIIGATNGVKAKVVFVSLADGATPAYLYIKYTASAGTVQNFLQGETLTYDIYSVNAVTASDYSAFASICSISEGVFYINGYFVGVNAQTVVVSAANADTATVTVGLNFTESVVTANDDSTLYDNALGFSNYSAPGADRYKISLDLVAVDPNTATDVSKFIRLIDINNGQLTYLNDKTKYSQIDKMLARRTFDESGNFVVSNSVNITANHLRNNFRDQWTANTYYLKGDVVTNLATNSKKTHYYATITGFSGATAPTHLQGAASDGVIMWNQTTTPYLNGGVKAYSSAADVTTSDGLFQVKISPIKAYIQGFEIQSQNTIMNIHKARDTKYRVLTQALPQGSFVYVTNIAGALNTSTINAGTIKDYAGASIGTCWVSSLEYASGTPGSAGIYRLYIYGVTMKPGYSFADHMKQIVVGSFIAEVSPKKVLLSGTVNATASTTITGKSTRFYGDLNVGSKIKIGTTETTVSTIANNFSMTVATTITITDGVIEKYVANYVNDGSLYIVPLPNVRMNSLRDANNALSFTYTISKYIALGACSGTSITTTLGSGTETFVNTNNHVVFCTTDSVIVNPTYSYAAGNTQLIINGLTNGKTYALIAIVQRTADAAKEKTKTLKIKTIILDQTHMYDNYDSSTLFTTYNFSSNSFPLSECDIVNVMSIKQSGGAPAAAYSETNEVNITSRYYCIDGTRNEYYGMATLKIKDPTLIPSAPIKVTFEYFDHSSGDFFSKNSYDTIPEEKIPALESKVVGLGDYIDFRSRMDDTGLAFSGSGSSVSSFLYSQSSINVTYSYYLPRYDLICLTKDGKMIYVPGKSDAFTSLAYPTQPNGTLLIAKVFVPPNPLYPKAEFIVTVQKYKRYTMYDIGRMDDRLSSVEKYVSLNMLEKQMTDLSVVDENGLDRFKNGFVVDSFVNSNICDITSHDFKADLSNPYAPKTMRPFVITNHCPVVESSNTTDASRLQNNYKVTGNTASLPYTTEAAIEQIAASSSEFINPFNVVVFEGDMQLFPEQDVWEQTSIVNKDVYI